MGVISKKLASRFHKAKKQVGDLRRQVASDFAHVPKDVKSVEALVRSGHDPLHAAFVAAQNFTSFFAEAVSQFREFDPYCEIVGPAEEEYMPDSPPLSPLTTSFFTTWAFFDVRFGPDQETIGTCLLDVADHPGDGPFHGRDDSSVSEFPHGHLRAFWGRRWPLLPARTGDRRRVPMP